MSKDPIHQPRGLAAATYSGLAVVGLAAMALVAAAGAAPHQGGTASLTSPAAQRAEQSTPPFTTRAEPRRLARRLLAKVALPAGTRRLRGRRLPAGLALGDLGGTVESAVLMRGTTIGTDDISYPTGRVAERFSAIQLVIEISPDRYGHALGRADVQVIWYPRSSAGEQAVAGDFRSVTINAWLYSRGVPHVRRTFRQHAIIDRLTRVLDSAPPAASGAVRCPAIFAVYELSFKPVRNDAGAVVDAGGRYSCSIWVNGHSHPAMVDNGSLD